MNAWQQLGIKPTPDTRAIRSAWVALLKTYHPDRGRTPEDVRKRTIRCAKLNRAYEEAVHLASTIRVDTSRPPTQAPPPRPSAPPPPQPASPRVANTVPAPPHGGWVRGAIAAIGVVAVLIGVGLFIFGGIPLIVQFALNPHYAWFMEPILRVVLTIGVYGFIFLGSVDLVAVVVAKPIGILVYDRFPSLQQFESKIDWALIVAVNLVFTFGIVPLPATTTSPEWFVIACGLAGALTVPLWLLWLWLDERRKAAKAAPQVRTVLNTVTDELGVSWSSSSGRSREPEDFIPF